MQARPLATRQPRLACCIQLTEAIYAAAAWRACTQQQLRRLSHEGSVFSSLHRLRACAALYRLLSAAAAGWSALVRDQRFGHLAQIVNVQTGAHTLRCQAIGHALCQVDLEAGEVRHVVLDPVVRDQQAIMVSRRSQVLWAI